METTGPFQTTRRWVHPPFTLRTTVCQRNRGPFRKQETKLLITLRTVEQRESISQRFISLRGKFEGPIPESWCCMLKQTSHDGAISSVPRPRCVRAQWPSQEMSRCVNNRQRRRSSLCSYPAKIQFERLSATVWQLWVGTHLHFWHIEKEIRRERGIWIWDRSSFSHFTSVQHLCQDPGTGSRSQTVLATDAPSDSGEPSF